MMIKKEPEGSESFPQAPSSNVGAPHRILSDLEFFHLRSDLSGSSYNPSDARDLTI